MSLALALVHERALVGAVDSFLKELVHVRPSLVQPYAHQLEEMSERWLAEGGMNELAALTPAWLHAYIAQADDTHTARQVLQEFYRWACQAGLVAANPLVAH